MSSKLNPDGISVKGCKIIYAPKGQAGEYSVLATSPFIECAHGCKYCFVPLVMRMNPVEKNRFHTAAVPRKNYLERLTDDARKYEAAGIHEQVMLSFTTDPYNPADVKTKLTRHAIMILHAFGLSYCTLTKGGSRALRDIDLFRPDRDAFASTLTSLNASFSSKWEPGAASPDDRMNTLQRFHEKGIFTWESLEPVLNTQATLDIIRETHTFVDFYKIGRANYLPMTRMTDWRAFTLAVIELCAMLNVRHYIKKDLQEFLPSGYPNPLRVPQHK